MKKAGSEMALLHFLSRTVLAFSHWQKPKTLSS
jgi:hypothetical protein